MKRSCFNIPQPRISPSWLAGRFADGQTSNHQLLAVCKAPEIHKLGVKFRNKSTKFVNATCRLADELLVSGVDDAWHVPGRCTPPSVVGGPGGRGGLLLQEATTLKRPVEAEIATRNGSTLSPAAMFSIRRAVGVATLE